MSREIHEIAVIGAGIAGASLAAELAEHAHVLVLEAEDAPGYHATGRSAAFWDECYGGPGVVPLTLASGGYLRHHGFLHRRGALYIARAGESAALEAFIKDYAGSGVTLERLSGAAVRARAARLRKEWCEALWEPACADIDVAGLHQHYIKRLKQAGAQLVCRAALARVERSNGVWTITTMRGETYRARRLVNAAGAWADQVALAAGVRPIGIAPKRRTVVQLRVAPAAPSDLPLVFDINGSFYFKPDAGRIWLSPHDEIESEPCDAAPEELDVALAIDRFEAATDWRIAAVERRWAGLRSFAPDRLPVYGPDPEVDDFFWFAGQGGFGIQTAPAAARLAAQLMLGQPRDAMTRTIDANAYSPARFSNASCAKVG
ncbi:MAG: FAD-dependent oxidoreductase [Erythrobacter sp.]|nr:FAD-dependent oxidoreductase [Erythrobacter sp.]